MVRHLSIKFGINSLAGLARNGFYRRTDSRTTDAGTILFALLIQLSGVKKITFLFT